MRQTYSLDEIKDMLLGQIEAVVDRYAPPARGAYTDRGLYWTLNPGRADRNVGSFCVHMAGPRAGRWQDFATGDHGDVLDLIGLSLGLSDPREQLREARAFLGLQTASAEDVARAREAADRAKARRREAEAEARAAEDKRRQRARALYLSGREQLRGTPVDQYLRGRGLDLSRLGRQPRALRYVPELFYTHTDQDTGEVIEGRWPAMVAAVCDARGRLVACHRTWLACGPEGWAKAPVPKAKKVLGSYRGAAINLWKGAGPRGGKPPSLPQCPPGTHVYVAEGIEDALSVVLLMPEARVLAGISLSNLAQLELPDNVNSITLVADLDDNEEARRALQRAVAAHEDAGRRVAVWQNRYGGKDLNDALRAARGREEGAA
ncbi:MAG: toprim domain-containing protein [Rhodosalinus sp.]